ncbi:MAG TPA: DUF3883 domain-containing protein [Campylobacterales bacterium]|nr:DUF3883 domain-containing protein [Campylobacterales bacterium]
MKHKNYEILNLIGYGLSKFNNDFIRAFGFKTKNDFYKFCVSKDIAEKIGVVKNRMDLFDPFFPNKRKGWWQKGDAYLHRKLFIDSLFGNLDVESYVEIIKMYLKENFNYEHNNLSSIKPIIKSKFMQLQKTGLEAEMYFLNNYANEEMFFNGLIEDTRLLGDGYDFQVEVKNNYFLAEVKGVRKQKGAVRLTNNEYIKANEYKDNYILSIVSNLNETPKMTLIPNPIKHLELDRSIIKSEQVIFVSQNIEW